MSLRVTCELSLSHMPDGAGPIGANPAGPTQFFKGAQVASGATPTAAQLTAAIAAIFAAFAVTATTQPMLATIQAFETGGN